MGKEELVNVVAQVGQTPETEVVVGLVGGTVISGAVYALSEIVFNKLDAERVRRGISLLGTALCFLALFTSTDVMFWATLPSAIYFGNRALNYLQHRGNTG